MRPILVEKFKSENSLPNCDQNNLSNNWQDYLSNILENKAQLVRDYYEK